MKYAEAGKIKKGDLVVIKNNQSTRYEGLVLEVCSDPVDDFWCYRVTLKQPGFDGGFRIENQDTRRIQRYEP